MTRSHRTACAAVRRTKVCARRARRHSSTRTCQHHASVCPTWPAHVRARALARTNADTTVPKANTTVVRPWMEVGCRSRKHGSLVCVQASARKVVPPTLTSQQPQLCRAVSRRWRTHVSKRAIRASRSCLTASPDTVARHDVRARRARPNILCVYSCMREQR
jgi:hypothetical protein